MDLRQAFGIRIGSELPLPELAPLEGGEIDVEIRLGPVSVALDGARRVGRRSLATPDAFLLDIEGAGRFLARRGVEITVDPAPAVDPQRVRLYLLGTMLGALCYQRGLLPLHANAVAADGRCVALAGDSGAGKSTLGARLVQSGCPFLADDVCALAFDAAGKAWAQPGVRHAKLWSDALAAMGRPTEGLPRVVDGRDKYAAPIDEAAPSGALPFDRLYLLGRADDTPPAIRRLGGMEALQGVIANLYRRNVGLALAGRAQVYAQALALIAQAPVFRFERPWGFAAMDAGVAALRRHLAEA
jgi:hypothetical protein